MKILCDWVIPQVDVEFLWTEVEMMILLSEQHYDLKCRELSQQGGVLYGMRNRFSTHPGPPITQRLDASTADLLAKTCEADPVLSPKIAQIFQHLNYEWRKMNAKNLR